MNVPNSLISLDEVSIKIGGDLIIDKVSLAITAGEIITLIGPNGAGKSTLIRAILGLIKITSGRISKAPDLRIGYMPQRLQMDRTIPLNVQGFLNVWRSAHSIDTLTALQQVSAQHLIARPMQSISGGELQRVSVARAMIPQPELLVADEPVSMIDASLRMNVVNLFKQLRDEFGVNILYITHDLSTAYYVSDRIAIMYRGRVVEYGPSAEILRNPAHPYTELLLDSVAKIGEKWNEMVRLPDLETKEYSYVGCRFAGRCPYVRDICRSTPPPLVRTDDGREVLCFKLVDFEPVTQEEQE